MISFTHDIHKSALIILSFCYLMSACQNQTIKQIHEDQQNILPQIDLLSVARACEGSKNHLSCDAWLQLYRQMSDDLSIIEVGYEITYQRIQLWLKEILTALESNDHQYKVIAYHLLYACLEKLEFRMIKEIENIFEYVETLLAKEQDPLWSIRYLKLLGRFLPTAEIEVIKSYTHAQHQIDVQSAAWEILTQRHTLEKNLQASEIIKASLQEYNSTLLSSLIKAASHLKMKQVIQWCDRDWWQGELFTACKQALVRMNHTKSFKLLKKWIRNFILEGEQTLHYDQQLAQMLALLTGFTQHQSLRKSYIKLIDQFFKQRRNEKAALYLIDHFLKIKPKEFALETILRYYLRHDTSIVKQSHSVTTHLKSLIHRLNHPQNF